jgi:hypothetical protein
MSRLPKRTLLTAVAAASVIALLVIAAMTIFSGNDARSTSAEGVIATPVGSPPSDVPPHELSPEATVFATISPPSTPPPELAGTATPVEPTKAPDVEQKPPTLVPPTREVVTITDSPTPLPTAVEDGVIILSDTNETLEGGNTYQLGKLQFTVPTVITVKLSVSTAGLIFTDTESGSVVRLLSGKEVYRRVADSSDKDQINSAFDALVESVRLQP